MKLLACLLLTGCMPYQYHVGASAGSLGFDRPVSDADTAALYVGVTWSPQQVTHNDRMEDYAMASLVANPRVDPLVLEALQDSADEAPEEDHIPFMPPVPENEDDRWNILAYGAVALMLAGATWIFSKRNKKEPE